jgi:hypothetical protein
VLESFRHQRLQRSEEVFLARRRHGE